MAEQDVPLVRGESKRCVGCDRVKARHEFPLTKRGQPYRRCRGCKTRTDPKPRAHYRTAEYKRALLRRQTDAQRAERVRKDKLRLRRWLIVNPDKAKAQAGQRRQRMMAQADGSVTNDSVDRLLAERSQCPYCCCSITSETAHLDHILALSLGGAHSISNLVACCSSCNNRKRARPLAEWLALLSPEGRATTAVMLASRRIPVPQGTS